jgi:hypothetical protein
LVESTPTLNPSLPAAKGVEVFSVFPGDSESNKNLKNHPINNSKNCNF